MVRDRCEVRERAQHLGGIGVHQSSGPHLYMIPEFSEVVAFTSMSTIFRGELVAPRANVNHNKRLVLTRFQT